MPLESDVKVSKVDWVVPPTIDMQLNASIKNRYHEGRGKRLKRYGDGWTDHGREYYQQLLGIFKNLQVK